MSFTASERTLLRDLAKQNAEIARSPAMQRRLRLWTEHNSLRTTYPILWISPEGSWAELMANTPLQCTSQPGCDIEWWFRSRLYAHQHFRDDGIVPSTLVVNKHISDTGWGVTPQRIASTESRGAWHFDPVIKEPSDLKKLRHPEVQYHEASTREALALTQEMFGDILNVELKGIQHISYHLMNQYTALRGLEEVMVDMYAEPQMLHDAMAFLTEGHQKILRQWIDMNLLSTNNDNTYHSSGGNGFTDTLPLPDANPQRIRPCDMWASAESQEMAQVSPEQHAEFALAYEKRLLAPFGLNGYGCCEDLTRKLDDVFTIPNIRRISISPWANVDACAEKLQNKYIFSWKPNPAHLVGHFDANAVYAYIRHTVEVTQKHGCILEIILKDTHTCENHPERFDEWTRIARKVIEDVHGPCPF